MALYVGAVDSNSGPLACTGSVLPHRSISLALKHLKITFIYLFLMHSKDNSQEPVLSYHKGLGTEALVVSLGSKCLDPMSHLTDSVLYTFE